MAVNSAQNSARLRPNCLAFPEVLAQSIALIAPTLTAALNAPLVFANAGNGAWLAFVMATVGLIFVGLNINVFARQSAAPGALYLYVARGLGSATGIICGWSLTLAYLALVIAEAGGFAHYANIVLEQFGVQAPSIVLYAVCLGVAWYYASSDIQLSTILMLVLELLSVGTIVILAVLVLTHHGFALDIEQLTLKDVTPGGISLGMVLAVLSFVGFESAATLGEEAKSPTRFIPPSLIWSTVLCGLFFIVISYTEILGFRGYQTPFNESANPLNVLATLAGVDMLGVILGVGICISCLGCTLASFNAAGRIMLSLARHNFYPSPMSKVHSYNQTPHLAISISALGTFLGAGFMALLNIKDIDIYGYLGTLSTYGFLCTYLLVSIAAPIYLARSGNLRQRHAVISFIAVAFMLLPIVGSFYPVPAFPYSVLPYLFLLYLLVGGILFVVLQGRSAKIVERMERDFTIATLKAIQNQEKD